MTMQLQDKLKLRELLFLFLDGLAKYPGDADRAEQGLQVLEKFVDSITERECSAILSGMVKIKKDFKN